MTLHSLLLWLNTVKSNKGSHIIAKIQLLSMP